MTINGHIEFVSRLKECAQKGKYLTRDAAQRVKVTDVKQEKNMPIKDIASTSKGCFDYYQQAELSTETKAKLMTGLKEAITAYKMRVGPWWKYILIFYLSKGGRSLRLTLSKATKQNSIYTRDAQAFNEIGKFNQIGKKQERELRHELLSLDNILTQVYNKVLARTGFDSDGKDLTCLDQTLAMKSYLYDLIGLTKVQSGAGLDPTIEALRFALYVANLQNACQGQHQGKNIKTELKRAIFEKIQDLKDNKKVGDQVILPGGYSSKVPGHAVIYQIKKTGDDTCSFTLMNADDTDDTKVVNISWEINFNTLSLNFIGNLQEEKFYADSLALGINKPMDAASGHLAREFKELGEFSGEHKAPPIKGNLAFKSVSSWIRESFGEKVDEYYKFKHSITEKEQTKLQYIIDESQYQEGYQSHKKLIDAMILGADQVQETRKGKIPTGIAQPS